MSYSPGPRQGILPRSLYLPSSFYEDNVGEKVHQLGSNQSSTGADSPSYVGEKVHQLGSNQSPTGDSPSYERYPNTQAPPASLTTSTVDAPPQSHFSPSTPSLEQGFGKYPHDDKGNVHGGSKDIQSQCTHGRRTLRHTLLLCTLIVLILVLIANVIFLDVHMMSHPSPSLDRAAAGNLKDTSSKLGSNVSPSPSSSPSSSISPTLSPTTLPSSSPNPSGNIVASTTSDIPSQAAACISQFLPNAPPPQAAAAYCAQCVSVLQNIPANWFVEESNGGTQGGADLQALSSALDFCNNVMRAGPSGLPQSTPA